MAKRKMNPNSLANLEKGKFKKGQITNPKGRPKNRVPAYREKLMGPEKAKQFQGISREEYFSWYETLLAMDLDELKALNEDATVPVFVKTYARAMVADMNAGRTTTVDKMMDKINNRSEQNRAKDGSSVDLAYDAGTAEATEAIQKRIKCKKEYIVKLLKKQGKYTAELSMQATVTAQLMVRTEMLAEEIFSEGHKVINVEISREGHSRESISPKEKLYIDLTTHVQKALRALGMNTDSKDRKTDNDSFADFMNEFKNDSDD
jgi:hypothetical protein